MNPLLRIFPESRSLRPLQARLGSGVMKALPVRFGAVNVTGWPVVKVVMALRVHLPTAKSTHLGRCPPKRCPRPKGMSHIKLPTARWRTSNVAGPFEQLRHFDI